MIIIGNDFTTLCKKQLRDGITFNISKLLACKTKLLGFKKYSCKECSHSKTVAFTCKGRFCSSCGKKQTDDWIAKATNVLPKTRWQHITFTMPESLWKLFWFNRNLLNTICGVAAGIIQEIAKKKNAIAGIFTALHTFGRDLKRNVHVHLSVTCGGLNDKLNWVNLFFPAAPIKKMWRHRIINLLRNEYDSQNLSLPQYYQEKVNFDLWMQKLYDTQWYVHLQKPSDNHKRNIEYLGRYIKRPPISEARIDEYDGEQVTFRFLDHYNGTTEYIKMHVLNFIARLVRHIPDRNFKMIRYYGFLSNRTRGEKLPLVYKAIKQVVPKIVKSVTWRMMLILRFNKDPLACPNCNIQLGLRQVYYGLSPPLLTLHIDHMINNSE